MSPVSCFHEIHLHKNELETFQLVQVINSWVCVWAAQDVRLCKAVDGGEDWWFSTTISEPGPRLGPARHRGQKLELVVSCCCCTRCIAVYSLHSTVSTQESCSPVWPPTTRGTVYRWRDPKTQNRTGDNCNFWILAMRFFSYLPRGSPANVCLVSVTFLSLFFLLDCWWRHLCTAPATRPGYTVTKHQPRPAPGSRTAAPPRQPAAAAKCVVLPNKYFYTKPGSGTVQMNAQWKCSFHSKMYFYQEVSMGEIHLSSV